MQKDQPDNGPNKIHFDNEVTSRGAIEESFKKAIRDKTKSVAWIVSNCGTHSQVCSPAIDSKEGGGRYPLLSPICLTVSLDTTLIY